MTKKESVTPIFLFETTNPKVVHISFSESGKEKVGSDSSSILEDLVENIDQSLRGAGYMYDLKLDLSQETIDIEPFEGIESFNQEVFDLISEELQFSDILIRDEDELEDMEAEE